MILSVEKTTNLRDLIVSQIKSPHLELYGICNPYIVTVDHCYDGNLINGTIVSQIPTFNIRSAALRFNDLIKGKSF